MILRSSARGHRPPGGFRCTCPPSPIENGGGLTGCPLIPTQARPPPRWGTTRGVWSTGARSPRALGTCDGHDLSVAPGRPPRSWPSPSPVRRPPPGRRPPAPGSPPSGQLTIDTPFAVRSWGLDEHRELAITASSRSPSSAIFSPTRRQRPATPRRWQVTRTAARSAAPERFPPAPASTSAARPGDAALHEPHVPRPRPPWFVLPRRTVTEDAVAVGRVGDVGPSAANLHDQGLAPASPAGAKRGRSGRRTAPTVLATCHQLRRRGRGRPRRDDRGSRRRAWEARDDAGRDLPTGVHLDQVRDLSGEPDHVGEPVVDRLQHGPVSSGWTVFRPAAGEPVVDRLQHRSSSSKRRKPSAHERTEHHVPPGDVDLPGLWTPAHRRAESGGRRGGRPQAVGNLAGERRRPCLRAGREIPTVPQRIIIIDSRVRTGLVPTMAAAGQCRSRSGGR